MFQRTYRQLGVQLLILSSSRCQRLRLRLRLLLLLTCLPLNHASYKSSHDTQAPKVVGDDVVSAGHLRVLLLAEFAARWAIRAIPRVRRPRNSAFLVGTESYRS